MYSRKSYAILIVALLALPMLTFAVPVKASTGAPYLGAIDEGYNLHVGVSEVHIQAGQSYVDSVDSIDLSSGNWTFTIIFEYNGTKYVDFSGAQFDLYMSKNGYSNITEDDLLYASEFSVTMLDLAYPQSVVKTNSRLLGGSATFSLGAIDLYDMGIGQTVNAKILTGPIPYDITPDYQYIKVWDGVSTLVAVALQRVDILPTLVFIPTDGPGCQTVVLSGAALVPNEVINLTYLAPSQLAGPFAQVTTDASGQFTYTWNIADLGNDYTYTPYENISIQAIYNSTGEDIGDPIVYQEFSRFFTYFEGVLPYGPGVYGNGTAGPIPVYVHGNLQVDGAFFNPCDDVTFIVEDINMGSATVLPLTGIFNASLTVPELSQGYHEVYAINNGVVYYFTIDVLPTLEINPSSGSCGTEVEFFAYGFPANEEIYIYWFSFDYSFDLWYNIVNGTTGDDGKFNVTVPYQIENSFGGIHPVIATDYYEGPTVFGLDFNFSGTIAPTYFTITPRVWIEPETIDNDCTIFTVYGCGFTPLLDYHMDVDNQDFNPSTINSDLMGDVEIGLIASGFRPGSHTVSFYALPNATFGYYMPVAYDCFTVSTLDDPIFGTLLSINESVATVQTSVETLQVSVDELNAKLVAFNDTLVSIQTELGTIQTNVQTINAKVDIISGNLATVTTTLGAVNGTVTSISGDMATVKTDLGTVKTTLNAVKTTTDSTKSFLPVDMTPVWITMVLALIAAIAAVVAVISIRGKSAA